MNRERRRFLQLAALASSGLGGGSPSRAGSSDPSPGSVDPTRTAGPPSGEPVIPLDAHAGAAGPEAPLRYGEPMPVLRLQKNALVRVRLHNGLSEPTNVDWHGMRLPNDLGLMPGPTGSAVAPGSVGEIALKPVDSGSYWFHPAFTPGRSNQTGRGLAGVAIVEDPNDPPTDTDKVLFLSDARPAPTGGPSLTGGGDDSPQIIGVNGKTELARDDLPPGTRLRLRIINGSTRLALNLGFQGARPLVVAIDGQPSELFAPRNNNVPVGPGARFDLMVDLPREPGAEFKVLSQGPEGMAGSPAGQPIYLFRSDGKPAAERGPIASLAPNPLLPRIIPLEHATRADMVVQQLPAANAPDRSATWSINRAPGARLPKKPLFSVKRNTPVTLGFTNNSPQLAAFRLQGHVMRLLHALDDGWEPYWRDSVLVPAGATHHAAFLADNPGRWLIESPFFDQATRGLRTWFEVL